MDIPPLWPVDRSGVVTRLRLVPAAAAQMALAVPALVLAVLTIVGWATSPVLVGLAILAGVVPATGLVTDAYRSLAGRMLGEEIVGQHEPTAGQPPLSVVFTWLRDPARWRELGHLAFSATGGLVMSGFMVLPLAAVATYLTMPLWLGWQWLFLLVLGPVWLVVWWTAGVPVLAARARVDRTLLGRSETEALRERVSEVTRSRAETVDHSAAELRRLERDLHDGPQARLASVGMSLGLAEHLMQRDPEEAAKLLAEARQATVDALDDLRSVVRGIHPPVLADRGLPGAVEAIALQLAIPVTVVADVPDRLPARWSPRRTSPSPSAWPTPSSTRLPPASRSRSSTTAPTCGSRFATTGAAAPLRPTVVGWPGWPSGCGPSTVQWSSTARPGVRRR